MIWIQQTNRKSPEPKLRRPSIVRPIIPIGRRIPVRWREAIACAIEVRRGEPHRLFDQEAFEPSLAG